MNRFFFFQAEDGIRDLVRSRGLGDVYKRQVQNIEITILLTDLYKKKYQGKIKLLRDDIQKAASTAIFYYGNSDKETEKKLSLIHI